MLREDRKNEYAMSRVGSQVSPASLHTHTQAHGLRLGCLVTVSHLGLSEYPLPFGPFSNCLIVVSFLFSGWQGSTQFGGLGKVQPSIPHSSQQDRIQKNSTMLVPGFERKHPQEASKEEPGLVRHGGQETQV